MRASNSLKTNTDINTNSQETYVQDLSRPGPRARRIVVVFVRVAHRRRRRRIAPCQKLKVTHLNRFQEILRYYYYY